MKVFWYDGTDMGDARVGALFRVSTVQMLMDGEVGQEWAASPKWTSDGRRRRWYRFNK